MKMDIWAAVSLKVKTVLTEFQDAQLDFKKDMRNKIKRQATQLDFSLNEN